MTIRFTGKASSIALACSLNRNPPPENLESSTLYATRNTGRKDSLTKLWHVDINDQGTYDTANLNWESLDIAWRNSVQIRTAAFSSEMHMELPLQLYLTPIYRPVYPRFRFSNSYTCAFLERYCLRRTKYSATCVDTSGPVILCSLRIEFTKHFETIVCFESKL